MFEKFGLLIDNEWRPAASGKTMPVHSPATEEEIGDDPARPIPPMSPLVLASAARGFADLEGDGRPGTGRRSCARPPT